jgi:hypothetical protein
MNMELQPEQIFYDSLYTLIKNLIIENKNFEEIYSRAYCDPDHFDIKERGKYILDKMEEWKHLINLE